MWGVVGLSSCRSLSVGAPAEEPYRRPPVEALVRVRATRLERRGHTQLGLEDLECARRPDGWACARPERTPGSRTPPPDAALRPAPGFDDWLAAAWRRDEWVEPVGDLLPPDGWRIEADWPGGRAQVWSQGRPGLYDRVDDARPVTVAAPQPFPEGVHVLDRRPIALPGGTWVSSPAPGLVGVRVAGGPLEPRALPFEVEGYRFEAGPVLPRGPTSRRDTTTVTVTALAPGPPPDPSRIVQFTVDLHGDGVAEQRSCSDAGGGRALCVRLDLGWRSHWVELDDSPFVEVAGMGEVLRAAVGAPGWGPPDAPRGEGVRVYVQFGGLPARAQWFPTRAAVPAEIGAFLERTDDLRRVRPGAPLPL